MCDQQSLRSACAYAQSDQSLCYSRLSIMILSNKLITKARTGLRRLVLQRCSSHSPKDIFSRVETRFIHVLSYFFFNLFDKSIFFYTSKPFSCTSPEHAQHQAQGENNQRLTRKPIFDRSFNNKLSWL